MISIAIATFKEALRKKLFILVGIITVVYIVLFGVVTHFIAKDVSLYGQTNMMSNINILLMVSQFVAILGFYFSNMIVAFFTVVASVGAISGEIESGIIHSVITKPLTRRDYVLGKYLGLSVLLIVYSMILFFGVLVICAFAKLPLITSLGILDILKGLGYFILEPLAILSLAFVFGVRFKTIVNGIIVAGIYILGLIGGMVEQIGAALKMDNLYQIGIIASLISPFDIIYRQMVGAIFSSLGVVNPLFGLRSIASTAPSKWMIVYIFIYIIGFLLLAIKDFNKRDIA